MTENISCLLPRVISNRPSAIRNSPTSTATCSAFISSPWPKTLLTRSHRRAMKSAKRRKSEKRKRQRKLRRKNRRRVRASKSLKKNQRRLRDHRRAKRQNRDQGSRAQDRRSRHATGSSRRMAANLLRVLATNARLLLFTDDGRRRLESNAR